MLGSYTQEEPLRIVGIDPGTDTLGVSVLDVCLRTNRTDLKLSTTFSGSSMARDYRWVSHIHGDKVARLKAHEDNLLAFFTAYCPHEVVSEAPFMGRFPAAYAALVECLNVIRSALIQYDFRQQLFTVDPPTVKNALGVNGKSGDKTLMQKGILDLFATSKLHNAQGIDLLRLDEHAIDSIAVAYTRAKYIIDQNVYTSQSTHYR